VLEMYTFPGFGSHKRGQAMVLVKKRMSVSREEMLVLLEQTRMQRLIRGLIGPDGCNIGRIHTR